MAEEVGMLAVLFENAALLDSARTAGAMDAFAFWGLPHAVEGTRDAASIQSAHPAETIWAVCETNRAIEDSYRKGLRVVAIGSGFRAVVHQGDIAVESVENLIDALGAHYTRTALKLRDLIASEFENT